MGFGIELDDTARSEAADFLWRHARLLERLRYLHAFANGPHEAVVDALLAYQNPDGGFGQALEPDKRCPDSQPVDVEFALRVMDTLDVLPSAPIRSACAWLGTVSTEQGGVPFSLPTLNPYPHAPWWKAPDVPDASLNPTAAIAGILHKHRVDHPWLAAATRYCYDAIAEWDGTDFHTAMPVVTFLEHAPDRTFATGETKRLKDRLVGTIETDPDAEGYVHLPLDWAPSPDAWLRDLFDDAEIELHLEALQGRQQDDGGWPISWPTVSDTVTAEWRGIRTLNALETLRAWA